MKLNFSLPLKLSYAETATLFCYFERTVDIETRFVIFRFAKEIKTASIAKNVTSKTL